MYRTGDHLALKVPQLAQTFPRKIGKPCLISMSQKINTIIDFFRYKKHCPFICPSVCGSVGLQVGLFIRQISRKWSPEDKKTSWNP